MEPPFTVTSIDAIEELPAVGGTLRWKPIRRTLGIEAFGVNAYSADAGEDVVEAHDETGSGAGGHEELYVVIRGHARFELDGEEFDAPAGTLVFAKDPKVRRQAKALADGTLVLAVGADPAAPYEVSAWETWFVAEAHAGGGDQDQAIAVMEEGRETLAGNPAYHYNFACYLTRAGRHDEAIDELRAAHAADPDKVARWGPEDDDLAPLRERDDWPLRAPT